MEATGTYWIELATYLDKYGFAVSVINPSRMRNYAKSLLLKPKNDLLDAQTLARLALAQKPAAGSRRQPSIESCPKG
jgi:transposase